MKRRVVVTGEGIVSSLGHSASAVVPRLKELRNCVTRSEDLATYKGLHTCLWAPCGYVRPERYTRKVLRTMSPVSEMSLFAAEDALSQAGLAGDEATLKGGRTGIAFGSCSGSVEANLDFASILVEHEVRNVTSSTYLKMMPQTVAVNLSVHFGTTGRLLPTGTACTSGSLAIGEAYEAVASGRLAEAERMLGRPYSISGLVRHGNGIGSTRLSCPTANLATAGLALPPFGVYAARARWEGRCAGGIVYVGEAPTIRDDHTPIIEMHLFDTEEDLYGSDMTVEFHAFLRESMKFDSVAALEAQIKCDIKEARRSLS